MPTKAEVLQEIDDSPIRSYTKEIVKSLVTKVKQERDKPNKLKVGDMFTYSIGTKSRPVVVIAIKDGLVYGVPLSSTEDEMNLMRSKSRFYGVGWFSKSIITTKQDIAMAQFIGIYDNEKLIRKLKTEIRHLLYDILL